MPTKNIGKIFAKIIKMYRAGYVRTAQASMGSESVTSALLKLILGSKKIQPMAGSFTKKSIDDMIKNITKKGFSS